jgi:xanthine dehydrogenase accessory factor
MQAPDNIVVKQAIEWVVAEDVWLCTVLATYGSSPRSPGAMLVANARGDFCGSLSGGCIEEDFLARVAQGEYRAASQIVRYGENGLEPSVALPCGGVLDVLVELLPAGTISLNYLQTIADALSGHYAIEKHVALPSPAECRTAQEYVSNTHVVRHADTLCLYIAAAPRLLIAGLSSVAIYCAEFALSLGFDVQVCENRPDALNNYSPLLPTGAELLHQFPANYLEKNGCHANTAIVALTHDPRMDDLTLMEAITTPAFYIGAMGSHKNSIRRRQRLQQIAEFSHDDLSRVKAPIGLPINSKTPAEIALAVMADIVKHKNSARENTWWEK